MSNPKYRTSKIDNKTYCVANGQFMRHLRDHNLIYKDYYEIYVTKVSPICACLKQVRFNFAKHTYSRSCGNPICVGKLISITKQNWTDEQRKQDSKNKRLAKQALTPEQKYKSIQKRRATYKQRYGAEWANSDRQKNKSQQTKMERYGHAHYSGWEKASHTKSLKTAAEHNVINNKRRKTNLERYGVENLLLLPSVKRKAALGNARGKLYETISGHSIHIRGYEGLVIDKLLEKYEFNDLCIDDKFIKGNEIPIFEYIDKREHTNKYYPDMYIKKDNLIIEVKSTWWWDGYGDPKYSSRLENNQLKANAVISNNYNYQVWLFDENKEHTILTNDDF